MREREPGMKRSFEARHEGGRKDVLHSGNQGRKRERGEERRIKLHANCWEVFNSPTACFDFRGPCSKSIKSICRSRGIYVIQVRNLIYNRFETILLLESQTDLEHLESSR